MPHSAQTRRTAGGSVLGFPLEGFSLFQSLLLSFAAAFFTFFLTTCLAIFALLAWNGIGHHTVDYADTYRYVGLPAGVIVLAIALPYFSVIWLSAKLRKQTRRSGPDARCCASPRLQSKTAIPQRSGRCIFLSFPCQLVPCL
jgi:hypothetical protein